MPVLSVLYTQCVQASDFLKVVGSQAANDYLYNKKATFNEAPFASKPLSKNPLIYPNSTCIQIHVGISIDYTAFGLAWIVGRYYLKTASMMMNY